MTTTGDRTIADWLLAMDEDAFRHAVAEECHRRADGELATGLRHPAVCARWLAALRVLLADVNAQFAQKREDRNPAADEWRCKALRWQQSLMARRDEARRVCAEQYHHSPQAREASERERRRRGELGEIAVRKLIDRHREEFDVILAQEFDTAGLELPATLRSRRRDRERVTAAEAIEMLSAAGVLRRREAAEDGPS